MIVHKVSTTLLTVELLCYSNLADFVIPLLYRTRYKRSKEICATGNGEMSAVKKKVR